MPAALYHWAMNQTKEMHDGPEAWTRFREAAKQMLTAKKQANPFGQGKPKKKKPTAKPDA